jgi:hypothetical protein
MGFNKTRKDSTRFENEERGLVSKKEVWVTIAGLVTVERLLAGDEVRMCINEVQSPRTSIGKNQRTSYNLQIPYILHLDDFSKKAGQNRTEV